jgi:polyferredoxin
MTELLTVVALNLGPILGLRAVPREMTELLAVAALLLVGVLWLWALLGKVVLGVTVAAGTLGDVGALTNIREDL